MIEGRAYLPSIRKRKEGFSLIELLIVIVIIAILSAIAIPAYIKHQNKSRVTSYALPIVKACANEASGYCSGMNIDVPTQINLASLKTCTSTIVPIGSLVVSISGSLTCQPNGYITDGSVTGNLEGVVDYHAKCLFMNNSIKCTVSGL